MADPHKPLRDDVRLLGELLGETLKAHAGEAIFQRVERVRALSKSARAGSGEDFRVLAAELRGMSLDEALPVTRAFAQFLHLANIAEQHQSQKEALAAAHCGLRARVLLWQVAQCAPAVNFTDCAAERNEQLRILMVQVYPSKASRASLLV